MLIKNVTDLSSKVGKWNMISKLLSVGYQSYQSQHWLLFCLMLFMDHRQLTILQLVSWRAASLIFRKCLIAFECNFGEHRWLALKNLNQYIWYWPFFSLKKHYYRGHCFDPSISDVCMIQPIHEDIKCFKFLIKMHANVWKDDDIVFI